MIYFFLLLCDQACTFVNLLWLMLIYCPPDASAALVRPFTRGAATGTNHNCNNYKNY
jgi:hypothetical protein